MTMECALQETVLQQRHMFLRLRMLLKQLMYLKQPMCQERHILTSPQQLMYQPPTVVLQTAAQLAVVVVMTMVITHTILVGSKIS